MRTMTRLISNTVDHGLKDRKGRTIGNYAKIEVFRKLSRDAAGNYIALEDGRRLLEKDPTYLVMTQTTRDGEMFGATSTQGTECSSLEDAKAVAVKKIVAAGKRFALAAAKKNVNHVLTTSTK